MRISFPFKRIFGLIGAMRVGKDSVADFLQESRGFTRIAFADQIKQEFGISNADFEAAKIAGNIEELRERLWVFSAEKRKEDPEYFIRKVIQSAQDSQESVIITDIRTSEELSAFWKIPDQAGKCLRRVYWVKNPGTYDQSFDEDGNLIGSKLRKKTLMYQLSPTFPEYDLRIIENDRQGLYHFCQHLDWVFFNEDIQDFVNNPNAGPIKEYTCQFDIRQKG